MGEPPPDMAPVDMEADMVSRGEIRGIPAVIMRDMPPVVALGIRNSSWNSGAVIEGDMAPVGALNSLHISTLPNGASRSFGEVILLLISCSFFHPRCFFNGIHLIVVFGFLDELNHLLNCNLSIRIARSLSL